MHGKHLVGILQSIANLGDEKQFLIEQKLCEQKNFQSQFLHFTNRLLSEIIIIRPPKNLSVLEQNTYGNSNIRILITRCSR